MGKIKDQRRRDKTVEDVQKRVSKRKGKKTYDDVMDLFILEEFLPLLTGAFETIRSKTAEKANEDGMINVKDLPGSFTLAYNFLSICEIDIEKLARKIKKY